VETGKLDEAIVHYREALALAPDYAEACNNLGDALVHKNAVKEALVQFQKAVQLDPTYAIARVNLGTLLGRTGQTDKAIVQLKKVVELKPDAASARRDLGHALADGRRFQEASVELEEAVKLSGKRDALALFLLGRVYTDLGRTSEGVQLERQALALASEQNNSALVQAVSAHLSGLFR